MIFLAETDSRVSALFAVEAVYPAAVSEPNGRGAQGLRAHCDALRAQDDVDGGRRAHRSRALDPEIKHKKPHSSYKLCSNRGFLCLISRCIGLRACYAMPGTGLAYDAMLSTGLRVAHRASIP
eukprot:1015905-Rhodomonas_salina.1